MASYNNRKSLVGFTMVAIVLAGLLFGGVYLSNRNLNVIADSGRGSSTSDVANEDNKTSSPAAENRQEDAAKQPESGSGNNNQSDATKRDESANTNKSDGSSKVTDGSALPQTGPAEDMISVLGLEAVTASIVAYYRSRRNSFGTL